MTFGLDISVTHCFSLLVTEGSVKRRHHTAGNVYMLVFSTECHKTRLNTSSILFRAAEQIIVYQRRDMLTNASVLASSLFSSVEHE